MSKWKSMRAWINKNDGKYFQIENHKLNIFQTLGYLLIIFSFVIYLFHDKTGFQHTWIGWVFLTVGIAFSFIGALKFISNE